MQCQEYYVRKVGRELEYKISRILILGEGGGTKSPRLHFGNLRTASQLCYRTWLGEIFLAEQNLRSIERNVSCVVSQSLNFRRLFLRQYRSNFETGLYKSATVMDGLLFSTKVTFKIVQNFALLPSTQLVELFFIFVTTQAWRCNHLECFWIPINDIGQLQRPLLTFSDLESPKMILNQLLRDLLSHCIHIEEESVQNVWS